MREGVFFNDIEGYSIKVNKKNEDGKTLEGLLIYDHSEKMGNTKVIKAKSGLMYTSKNNRYLYLELFNGNSYEEVDPRDPKKRVNLPFARSSFKKQKIRFDMASFQLERSDEERYSNAAQFMNLSQLNETSDSLKKSIKTRLETYQSKLQSYYKFATVDSLSKDSIVAFEKNLKNLSRYKKNRLHKAAANMVRSSKSYVYNTQRELKFKKKKLKKAHIEWHRKFSLSFACIILFLIGAPLGAIIRKGGMGMPVLVSIIFFLIYHISSITGEKSALQDVLTIKEGMWLSSMILTPLGLFFSYKAANDSNLINTSKLSVLLIKIKQLWKQKKY
jgi:lipopolysaccharide export system permease protein